MDCLRTTTLVKASVSRDLRHEVKIKVHDGEAVDKLESWLVFSKEEMDGVDDWNRQIGLWTSEYIFTRWDCLSAVEG